MSARPTTHDIARAAGVSLATVDRVINERPGVKTTTRNKVHAAIAQLNYVRDVSAANLAKQRTYRFVFALPAADNQFMEALSATVLDGQKTLGLDRIDVRTLTFPAENPHAIARELNALNIDQVDGVALMAPETPHVRDALQRFTDAGCPVVSVISDLPNTNRHHFVGIDNVAAGRTAAVLLGRFTAKQNGQVIVLTDSMHNNASLERRLGFDEIMLQQFPRLTVLPTLETHGDNNLLAQRIEKTFEQHADIVGVYSLGPGNRSLSNCLRTMNLSRHPVVIVHELTPHTIKALRDSSIDAVIAQDLRHIVRSALRVLRAGSDKLQFNIDQERIRIEIILKENLL